MTWCEKYNGKSSFILRMLCYWGKVLGLNVFVFSSSENMKLSYSSVLYALFISSIYIYMLYLFTLMRWTLVLPGETPLGIVGDLACLGFTGVESLMAWCLFVLRHNRVKTIVHRLRRIEKISQKVNLNDDNEKLFVELGIVLIIMNCGCAIWSIMSIIAQPNNEKIRLPFVLMQVLSFNIVTLFVWIVAVMRLKFHRLNEKILKFVDHDCVEMAELHDRESLRMMDYSRFTPLSERIDAISQLHRELRDFMSRIEELFASIILMNVIKQLWLIVVDVHIMYRFVKECKLLSVHDFVYITEITCWVIVPILIAAIISNVCGSTSQKANETGNILHGIAINTEVFRNNTEIAKLHAVSLDLLGNQVKITLYGLIELDKFFVYRMVITAISYLTIMLQFYD